MTMIRGAGDRWFAGEPVEGVTFAHHQAVEIVGGPHDGERGTIALLAAMRPEPEYIVTLAGGDHARLRQSELKPAE